MKKNNTKLTALTLCLLLVVLLAMELTMKSTSMLFTVLKKGAIYALVAVSMNLLNGFTGLFSLGQAGFMLLGAYTYAILTVPASMKDQVYYLFGAAHCPYPLWICSRGSPVPAARAALSAWCWECSWP